MAVVTSSVPLGGELGDSGAGSAVRARSVDSASEGAPARTGRGPCAGAAFGFATARGLDAAFGFAAARGFGFAFVAVADFAVRALPPLAAEPRRAGGGKAAEDAFVVRLLGHISTSLRFACVPSGHPNSRDW